MEEWGTNTNVKEKQKNKEAFKTYLTNTYIFSTCHTADIVQYHPQIQAD